MLDHVTVEPAWTVNDVGVNMKFLITIPLGSGAAAIAVPESTDKASAATLAAMRRVKRRFI
jgi:hypothetical protein